MSKHWITFDQVFDGQALHPQASVRLENDQIAEVATVAQSGQHIAGCLTPGFLDLQVNGGGGVMLNNAPSLDSMRKIAQAHRAYGTVGIMPTVITDRAEVLEQAAEAALRSNTQPELLGLHIEGPHLSKARRGTHCADFIRPITARTHAIVETLRQAGIAVMITLAPETVELDDISRLAATGAVVSIGHTDATADQITQAVAAGANCATHLFNAMSPMTSRAPGAVGGVLSEGIQFGIICDGFHVDDRMLKLALRARVSSNLGFLVSDAMATIGGPDRFDLYGQEVRLREGRLVNTEGNLAGAHFTQAQGVQRLVHDLDISLENALKMAVTTPAHVIGRPDLGQLIGRSVHDVLILNNNCKVAGTLASETQINAAQ